MDEITTFPDQLTSLFVEAELMILFGSLPRIFRTTVDTIPNRAPYLMVDEERASVPAARAGGLAGGVYTHYRRIDRYGDPFCGALNGVCLPVIRSRRLFRIVARAGGENANRASGRFALIVTFVMENTIWRVTI